MTDLFNTKDLLTVATVDQAVIGTKGFFGDNLSNLIEKVRQGKVETLTDVMPNEAYCFGVNEDSYYIFFLPEDKVKEPTYRPFNCLDELFDFFFPELIKDNFNFCDQTEKALFFLGKTLILKDRYHDYIKVMTIKEVDFINNCSGDGGSDNIELNCFTLLYLFNNFEIKKDGKFVPFGVKE